MLFLVIFCMWLFFVCDVMMRLLVVNIIIIMSDVRVMKRLNLIWIGVW